MENAKANKESGEQNISYPMAITMWDFSWLERQWPGAGYENCDKALDQLSERGYNCVRIDAYPHLIANDPFKEYLLDPHWDNQDWGSPGMNKVQVQPALNNFIRKCAERNIRVALSTWWREDTARLAKKIKTPEDMANVWQKTILSIDTAGLLQNIEFVDLSNEFPLSVWTPYFEEKTPLNSEKAINWMKESIKILKQSYPVLKYTYSFTGVHDYLTKEQLTQHDLIECHIWMVQFSDFYKKAGYHFAPFGGDDYKNLALKGRDLYYANREGYLNSLKRGIQKAADWSVKTGKPLGTTECWGVVDYKDFPLLEWDYVKELCEAGTLEACKKGRWLYIATSNFCGPQFKGMWRDVQWHKRLTDSIKNADIDKELIDSWSK